MVIFSVLTLCISKNTGANPEETINFTSFFVHMILQYATRKFRLFQHGAYGSSEKSVSSK
jgi:hypothetical protein